LPVVLDWAPEAFEALLGRAVTGAHILHMLRDTYVDLRAGYWNIPCEVLERHSIGPGDVHSDAYREWVEARVRLAFAMALAREPGGEEVGAALEFLGRYRDELRSAGVPSASHEEQCLSAYARTLFSGNEFLFID